MLNSKPTKKSDPAMASRLKMAIQRGPSQTAIAQACGVTDQAVTGWLKTGRINKNHLPTISRLCGVDLNWLITGDGSDQQKQTRVDLILDEIRDWDDKLLAEVEAQIDLIKRRKAGLL